MGRKKIFKPAVTVDIVILNVSKTRDLEILLIKRKNPPFKDCWALPGGFIEENETLEESAKRELFEETGMDIKVDDIALFGVAGNPGRDPRGRTISIVYIEFIKESKIKPKGSDDAKEAKWFSVFNLPPLAFDHKEILDSRIGDIKKMFKIMV